MSDRIDRFLSEEDQGNSGSEQIWNLFSQILVPIVILLSFVAVSEIARYQVVTLVTEEENAKLQGAIADLQHTDVGTMGERYKIQLIEAQKQRLLHALDQEIANQRGVGHLGLVEFPDKRLVNLSGGKIDDPKFGSFCKNFRDEVVGNGSGRALPDYIRKVYKEVLRRAGVSDPNVDDRSFSVAASMRVPVWPEVRTDPQPDNSRITPTNRQFILNEIALAIVGMTAEVTKLQQGVLERIYSALLRNPEELDDEGRKKAREFLQLGLTAGQSASRLRDFYEYLNRQIKDDLDRRGYRFLDSTWEAVRLPQG
jgi:hypothetical protein